MKKKTVSEKGKSSGSGSKPGGVPTEKSGTDPTEPTEPTEPAEPTKPTSTGLPFTDVKATDWFYDAAKYVFDNKLMNGTETTSFEPLAEVTRGMFATVLLSASK